MSKYIGMRIGKLVIVGLDDVRNEEQKQRELKGEIKRAVKYYLCKCDCGNVVSIGATKIFSKTRPTKSCGCYAKETTKIVNSKENKFEFLGNGIVKGYSVDGEKYFLISEIDYINVKEFCWCQDAHGYWITNIRGQKKGTQIKLHQFIMKRINDDYDSKNSFVIDHINRKRYDNTRENLRLVTHSENMKNISIRKDNSTGVTGVSKDGTGYIVKITTDKQVLRRWFKTFEEAIAQRLEWEKEFGYFGENNIE